VRTNHNSSWACSLLHCAPVVLAAMLALTPAQAQLRGHGGPVKALAISPDGTNAISGSFDTSAIRWSLSRNAAEQVLRFHDGAVNAVAYLKNGRIVTAGADAHIAIWTPAQQEPDKVHDGHVGPIEHLACRTRRTRFGVMGSHRPPVAQQWWRTACSKAKTSASESLSPDGECGRRGLWCDNTHWPVEWRRDCQSADTA
jgi:WD40 repeat protein